jgi:hypothetical protein
MELLRPLRAMLPGRILPEGARRTRATPAQASLPADQRRSNLKGVFACDLRLEGRRIAVDYPPMDFAMIARGMGCDGVRVDHAAALADALAASRQAAAAGRTTVIDVAIDPAASHVPVSDY